MRGREGVQIQLQSELLKETLGWSDEAMHMHSQNALSKDQSGLNSGMPTQPVCFADVSLSLAMTYWKERSSEGKVAGQEQLLAVVEVVVNSLRRYLKRSRLQLAVSSLLAFACRLGQQFCAQGPGCRGPRWIMAHFFQAALGERASESRSSLSGC